MVKPLIYCLRYLSIQYISEVLHLDYNLTRVFVISSTFLLCTSHSSRFLTWVGYVLPVLERLVLGVDNSYKVNRAVLEQNKQVFFSTVVARVLIVF